jgi:hypothetical protein
MHKAFQLFSARLTAKVHTDNSTTARHISPESSQPAAAALLKPVHLTTCASQTAVLHLLFTALPAAVLCCNTHSQTPLLPAVCVSVHVLRSAGAAGQLSAQLYCAVGLVANCLLSARFAGLQSAGAAGQLSAHAVPPVLGWQALRPSWCGQVAALCINAADAVVKVRQLPTGSTRSAHE